MVNGKGMAVGANRPHPRQARLGIALDFQAVREEHAGRPRAQDRGWKAKVAFDVHHGGGLPIGSRPPGD